MLLELGSAGGLDFSNKGADEASGKVCGDICTRTTSTGFKFFSVNIIVANKIKARQQATVACFVGKYPHIAKVRCKCFLKEGRYFMDSPAAKNSS